MAFIFSDSFDFYTVGSSPEPAYGGWTSFSNISISSTVTRFGTGKSLTSGIANSGAALKSFTSNSSATIYINCALYWPVLNGSTAQINYITLRDVATDQITIVFTHLGSIQLYRGSSTGTLLATYSNAFAATVWTQFQFKIKIDPSAGTFEVRKNGNPSADFTATGLNTRASANSYVNGLLYNPNYLSTTSYMDDLLIFDDNSASAPNSWVGDVRSYSLTATADTAQKDFTPVGSTSNYANVGKFAPNAATYNYSGTVGNIDLFNITDLTVTPASIVGVTTKNVMLKSDSNPRVGQTVIKSSSTTTTGATYNLSTTYTACVDFWPTDPATSSAWISSGIDALQVGYKVAS